MSSLSCCSFSSPILPKAPACAAGPSAGWDSLVFAGRPAWALARPSIRVGFPSRYLATGKELQLGWSFVGGGRILYPDRATGTSCHRKGSRGPSASWLTSSQIATSAFTWGTLAVLPFYTLMVVAPNAPLTRKSMESTAPYVALGLLYTYLLYLSWTPDTLRSMFASKYWLPELAGIAKMFSNEMTVASAWIHLLAVDLFAARQVFHDGLKSKVETRHSVSLCLLFCPIGIVTHAVTKLLTKQVIGHTDH